MEGDDDSEAQAVGYRMERLFPSLKTVFLEAEKDCPTCSSFIGALAHLDLTSMGLEVAGDEWMPPLPAIAQLTSLTTLSLSIPCVCDLPELAACTRLQHLTLTVGWVCGHTCSAGGLAALLAACTRLQHLKLEGTYLLLDEANTWDSPSLRELHIDDIVWPGTLRALLEGRLPSLQVVSITALFVVLGEEDHIDLRYIHTPALVGLVAACPARFIIPELIVDTCGTALFGTFARCSSILRALQPLVNAGLVMATELNLGRVYFEPGEMLRVLEVLPAVVRIDIRCQEGDFVRGIEGRAAAGFWGHFRGGCMRLSLREVAAHLREHPRPGRLSVFVQVMGLVTEQQVAEHESAAFVRRLNAEHGERLHVTVRTWDDDDVDGLSEDDGDSSSNESSPPDE